MTGFQNLFSGSVVKPSQVQYQPIIFGTNTQLYWPTETLEGVPYVAAQIDATATTTGLSLVMPAATSGSTGVATLVSNVGQNAFNFTDQGGDVIVTIAPSEVWLISLTDNTTANGIWQATQFGATVSLAQSAGLAGPGLVAAGSQLELNWPTNYLGTNTTLTASYRASAVVWNGIGAGTFQMDTIANLGGGGWFAFVSNEGGGPLTLSCSMSQTINGQSTLTLPAGTGGQYYTALVICSATGFNAFGYVPTPTPINAGGTNAITAPQALQNLGGSALGISIFEAPNAASVVALLGLTGSAFNEVTVNTPQSIGVGSANTAYVCTAPLSMTLPVTTTLTKGFYFVIFAQAGAVTLIPSSSDAINGNTAGANFVIPQGGAVFVFTDANGNWWLPFLSGAAIAVPWNIASGSANAITCSYAPAVTTLTDGLLLTFRATGQNTISDPTFSPSGLTAENITKQGGQPLVIGDIAGQYAEYILRYNLAFTRWELLNPSSNTSAPQATIASNNTTDLGSTTSTNIFVTGTTTITALGSSANVQNPIYYVQFQASLLLTYNASSLILPGAASIQTQAGDAGVFEYLGSGNWTCLLYQRGNGQAISMSGKTITLASASTTDLGTSLSNSVYITGTTTIASFGSSATLANPMYFIRFAGALTLTYNAGTMVLPGNANILTAAGDTAIAEYVGSGDWIVRQYTVQVTPPPAIAVSYSGFATFTLGTDYSFAHGLGVTPDQVLCQIQCQTANASFSPGDTVYLTTGPVATLGYNGECWANATTAGFSMQDFITLVNKGSGGATNITVADWEMQLIAVKYNF